MSTLAVVEDILRETQIPMSVREIVERAGVRLPSKSKTPDTVVARDLAMDLKRKGDASIFARTSPGRYTLRVLALALASDSPRTVQAPSRSPEVSRDVGSPAVNDVSATPVLSGALRVERAAPLAARKPAPAGEDSLVAPHATR